MAGRPTKYRPEFCATVKGAAAMAIEGMTDAAIGAALDVDPATVRRWRDDHPDFAEACATKEILDSNVEASLYQRAMGYSHKAVKIFMPASAPEPVYADYIEHYPPDATSMIFWLKNRKPKEWREKIEHVGPDDGPITIVIKRASDGAGT